MEFLPEPGAPEASARGDEVRVGETVGGEASERHFVEQVEGVLVGPVVRVPSNHGVVEEDVRRVEGRGEEALGVGHGSELGGAAEEEGGEGWGEGEGGGEEEAMDLLQLVEEDAAAKEVGD